MGDVFIRLGFSLVLAACCVGPARAELLLEGVDGPVAANILSYLRLDEEPCDAPRQRIRQRYRALAAKVREAVQPFGYYAPVIDVELRAEPNCWQIVVKVALGDPVRIRALDVAVMGAATEDRDFSELIPFSRLAPDQVFVHADYEAVKKALVDVSEQRGYFDGTYVEHRVAVNKSQHAADVALRYDSGPRYTFGEVRYQTDIVSQRLLRRYPAFKPGDAYHQSQTLNLYQDLLASGYFSSVQIERELKADAGTDREVDLRVDLQPRPRWGFGAGLGYGTDTGPVVSGEILNRRVNQRGHRASWDNEISAAAQSSSLEYRIPGHKPATDWHSVFIGYQAKETEALRTEGWHGGVRRGKQLTRRWFETRYLDYSSERLREDENWRQEQALVPGVRWLVRAGATTPRPRRGFKAEFDVSLARENFLSDTSFVRTHVTGKLILPIWAGARLLLRGEAGHLAAESFDGVPPSWRFFAGGDASVRGYDYQSLGPTDSNSETTGGSRLLTGSAELDFAVTERWSGALFVDAGSVSLDQYGEGVSMSVGAGVRWYSPLGPVRVDFAFPQQGDDRFRLHISLGPDL